MTRLLPPQPASSRGLKSFVAALALAVSGFQAEAQLTLYTETFTNSTSGAKNFGTVGWFAHVGANATDLTTTTALGASDDAVIWTTAGQGGTIGYGYSSSIESGGLFWTTEFGSLNQDSIGSISFWSNNNSTTTSSLRLAIRLDNNTPTDPLDDLWYATSTAFIRDVGTMTGSSGNWATNGELELFNFTKSADAWLNLDFTPGATLALDSTPRTVDLPAGEINALGLYGSGTSQLRFDTVEVTSVPEPSTVVLSAGALVGLLAFRRRR